jgi:hypothetical protein
MRRGSRILAVLALLTFPALADPEIPPGQDGGPDRPQLIEFGQYFFPIAKTFGCNDFRWAAFGAGKRSMSLEYVPAGANINQWTRLMTVTVFPLPQLVDAQREAMKKIQAGLLGNYSKGKIISEVTYTDQNGDPRLFLEYEIGEGLQKEHNAGTFLRARRSSAAFVQIQSRGKEFDGKDADNMKLFAENRLHLSGN